MPIFDTENDFAEFAEFIESINQIKIDQESQNINNIHECPICLEAINDPTKIVTTCCNHIYCQPCYDRISVCSLCRTNLNKPIQHRHNQIQNDQMQFNDEFNEEFNEEFNDEFNFANDNNNDNGLRMYATNYNVLRIMAGLGGLAYSN